MVEETFLFVDALGVSGEWVLGNSVRISHLTRAFERVVMGGAEALGHDHVRSGLFLSDSAVLLCSSPRGAVDLGAEIFRRAFQWEGDKFVPELWLRGVVISAFNQNGAFGWSTFESNPRITKAILPARVTDAYILEKSGFKGMRLLLGRKPGDFHEPPDQAIPDHVDLGPTVETLGGGAFYPDARFRLTHDVNWTLGTSTDSRAMLLAALERRVEAQIEARGRTEQLAATKALFR